MHARGGEGPCSSALGVAAGGRPTSHPSPSSLPCPPADFFYSLTDSFGQKWALQTVPKNLTTEEEFDDWLAQAQYPEGFSLEKIPLNETGMIHPPYVVGESCYSMVVKDNLFNSYHLWQ